MKRIYTATVLVALAVTLSGCVIALGNRDASPPREIRPTVGQQLIDLKKAREAGAISEEEYETQKARVLSSKSAK
jgi:hypothetical protein